MAYHSKKLNNVREYLKARFDTANGRHTKTVMADAFRKALV